MKKELFDHAIETPRLVLFPYTEENLRLFNTDLPAFERTYGVIYHGEELDHLLTGYLKKLEKQLGEDPEHRFFFTEFLIVKKDDDRVIGSVDYKYAPVDGATEVGYGLNPRYEGHGYMTEALEAFLRFGETLGVRKVLAETLKENVRSQNVLKRCGFVFIKEDGNLWWEKTLGKRGTTMEDVTRIDRIMDMEGALDRAAAALRQTEDALDALDGVTEDLHALANYYDLGAWREDFEADEAGLLPSTLKRGVLSEDALYDLLGDYDRILRRFMQKIMEENRPDEA